MNSPLRGGVILLILVSTLRMTGLTQGAQAPTAGDAWSDLTTIMETMHRDMASVKPSGSSDRDFVALMVPHHQAAIEMAKAELLNGNDAQMRRLAQEIIADQQSEIELMQLWLKQHPAQQR